MTFLLADGWTSLEIVKLLVSVLTPLIGFFIALKLARIGKDIEKKQWAGRKIIEKRLEFYDEVVPDLNDLYCFYNRVGNWKELTPPDIIAKKRQLDKAFNIYAYIFSQDIRYRYSNFIHNCFETHTGAGEDAKIIMKLTEREILPGWDSHWNKLFWPEKQVSVEVFKKSYQELLELMKEELEVH